jgi:hypothetical protein
MVYMKILFNIYSDYGYNKGWTNNYEMESRKTNEMA